MTAGADDTKVSTLIGIAMPVTRDFTGVGESRRPKFFIHGERDELSALKDVRELYARAAEPKELVVIDAADHLFDGKVGEVADAIEECSETGEKEEPVMNEAVIVSAVRTPVGKAPTGVFAARDPTSSRRSSPKPCGARAGLDPAEIDDVILGCAMPEAEQGLNVARIASLRAGIPVTASAVTINRFCSSGLQAIASAPSASCAARRRSIVAGGTESMSLVPMGGHKVAPNPTLVDSYPDVYLSTGLVAENHAPRVGISRERSRTRSRCAAISGRLRRSTPAVSTTRSCRSRRARRCATVTADLRPRRCVRGRRAAPRHVAPKRWRSCGRHFTCAAP